MSQEPMTTPTPGVAELPVARPHGCPFDPPSELGRIRRPQRRNRLPRNISQLTPTHHPTIHRHPQDTP
jgi:hypothetical protein